MLLIGYESNRWQKICTSTKAARKALRQESAEQIQTRMMQLAAFNDLGQIPIRQPPLYFHALRADRSGEYSVRIHNGDVVVFTAVGTFEALADGTPNLKTVTEVSVTFVGNYHSDA
jgi:hypothetical protein